MKLNTHKQKHHNLLLALTALGLSLGSAHAATLITGGGFESPVPYGTPTGWTGGGTASYSGDWALGATPAAGEGSQWAFLAGTTSLTSSDLGAVDTGFTYTFTLALGNRLGSQANPSGTYTVDILIDGSAVGTSLIVDPGTEIATDEMEDFSVAYTATALDSGQLSIRIEHASAGPQSQGAVDNVRLDVSPIPEPSAALLSGLGLLALLRRRR